MVFVLRHIVVFGLQFGITAALIVAAFVGDVLNTYGMAYRRTPQFAADLHDFIRVGMLGGGFVCLVLLCYHMTKLALNAQPPPPPDNNLF